MGRFGGDHELERMEGRLRDERPRPSDDLLGTLTTRIEARGARPANRPAPRRALAGVFAVVVLGLFAAFGGTGYAKSLLGLSSSGASASGAAGGLVSAGATSATNPGGQSGPAAAGPAAGSSTSGSNGPGGAGVLGSDGFASAHHQYVRFILVCLHVNRPGNGDQFDVGLIVPQAAGLKLIQRGLAHPPPCNHIGNPPTDTPGGFPRTTPEVP